MRKTYYGQKLGTFSPMPASSEEGEGLEIGFVIHHACVRKPEQKSLRYRPQRDPSLVGTCMTGTRMHRSSKETEAPGLRAPPELTGIPSPGFIPISFVMSFIK